MKKALLLTIMLTAAVMASETKVTIDIEGMTCNGCVNSVTTALNQIEGVQSAEVNLKPGCATVTFDDERADSKQMLEAISKLGYKATLGTMSMGKATHCDSHVSETKIQAEVVTPIKPASAKSGCPLSATCKSAGTKDKCTPASAKLDKASMTAVKTEAHTCPTLTECKELIAFHDAMHPLHMALEANDYEAVRAGYPSLKAKADAVVAMKCDKSCVTDVSKFDERRAKLQKSVDGLGKAVSGNNDEKLAKAFDKMHDAYVALGQLAK